MPPLARIAVLCGLLTVLTGCYVSPAPYCRPAVAVGVYAPLPRPYYYPAYRPYYSGWGRYGYWR